MALKSLLKNARSQNISKRIDTVCGKLGVIEPECPT